MPGANSAESGRHAAQAEGGTTPLAMEFLNQVADLVKTNEAVAVALTHLCEKIDRQIEVFEDLTAELQIWSRTMEILGDEAETGKKPTMSAFVDAFVGAVDEADDEPESDPEPESA